MAQDAKDKEAKPAAEAAAPAAGATAELKAGSFTFKAPAGWKAKAEPRQMSAGGFTTAGKDGAAGLEADFYHFGAGGGGGVDANVTRWQRQFEPGEDGKAPEVAREELTFGENKALLVTIKGTFLSGPVMSPKKTPMPGYAMLGAILGSKEGDVFVKVTGPEATVEAARADVKKMIEAAYGK